MNKSVMTAIFATGLAAAGWVGWGFIGHSPLALAMTVMIAAALGYPEIVDMLLAAGADAALVVTPYYNKTSQAGLIAHYTAIANAVTLPCIIYNVPSRTGVNLQPATLAELAKLPNVNAVKEASGNISQVADVAALCGEELNIYSGNDDQIVPILSLGGKGVISVLSNVAPQQAHDICAAWFSGDTAKSLELQLKALPLCHALFADVNPIPVKWAMNRLGWNAGPLRLPLVEPSAAVQQSLENEMKAYGVLK